LKHHPPILVLELQDSILCRDGSRNDFALLEPETRYPEHPRGDLWCPVPPLELLISLTGQNEKRAQQKEGTKSSTSRASPPIDRLHIYLYRLFWSGVVIVLEIRSISAALTLSSRSKSSIPPMCQNTDFSAEVCSKLMMRLYDPSFTKTVRHGTSAFNSSTPRRVSARNWSITRRSSQKAYTDSTNEQSLWQSIRLEK
jgi:hypothetical protein